MATNICKVLVFFGAMCLLAACGSFLHPKPDRSEFFVLPPKPWSEAKILHPCAFNIAVVRVEFSEYLDNSQIATRPSREQIVYSQWDRWAEPLSSGLTRTLVTNLSYATGSDSVVQYPNRLPGYKPDVMIYVYVASMDGVIGGECRLLVRWRITSGDGLRILDSGDTYLKGNSGESYGSYVKALSRLWSDFADDLAGQIDALEEQQKLPKADPLDDANRSQKIQRSQSH